MLNKFSLPLLEYFPIRRRWKRTRMSCILSAIPAYCQTPAEQDCQRHLSVPFYIPVCPGFTVLFFRKWKPVALEERKIATQHRERVNKELVLANRNLLLCRLVLSADWWMPQRCQSVAHKMWTATPAKYEMVIKSGGDSLAQITSNKLVFIKGDDAMFVVFANR